MVVSHPTASMQWETKARFSGQVKPVGIENSMSWKTGTVHFDHDAGSGSWMAKLYFKVNPTKVSHQVKIQKPDNLDVKCGRLMIENKKGDGIHIKLLTNDISNAKLLVSKIKSSLTISTPTNRAEVGLISSSLFSNHKGSENVSPFHSDDYDDLSLFHPNNDLSPECQTGGFVSKKTPPTKNREHSSAPKRRLELFSPERESGRNSAKEEERLGSNLNLTGMKDYSKRNLQSGDNLSANVGLGARIFYGAEKSLTANSDYRNTSVKYSKGVDRIPANKRLKLSVTSHDNRMSEDKACDFTSSLTDEMEGAIVSIDSPVHSTQSSRKHFLAGETIGFQNLGNTCFLNSPLQCLSSLEPFTLDIQSAIVEFGMELNRNSVIRKLYLLMKVVRTVDVCSEHVKELLTKLRSDMDVKFAPNTQQDAHEFLSEVLNRVDDEVKAARRLRVSARPLESIQSTSALDNAGLEKEAASSSIEENPTGPVLSSNSTTPTEVNFGWSYRTDIYFHECKTQVLSSQTEHEMTLMLAFDSSTKSLQDCINKYFESTEVEMKCEKCGKEEKATITRKIVRRPRVFILNLLRYRSDNLAAAKKGDTIRVPSYISVYGYCTDDVSIPVHVDPVFMMDREADLGFHSLDNPQTCRCKGNAPESTSTTAVAIPKKKLLQDLSVFEAQEECLSNLTADSDELNNMISDFPDHFVPNYKNPKEIYNKILTNSKDDNAKNSALMPPSTGTNNSRATRQSYVEKYLEANMDFSDGSTSIMFSILSDSKLRDPLLKTSKGFGNTQKLSEINKTDEGATNSSTLENNENKEDTESSPDRSNQTDSYTEDYDLTMLSDFIHSNLKYLDQYMSDAQALGNDTMALYDNAQIIVSMVNENIISQAQRDCLPPGASLMPGQKFEEEYEMTLCIALLKKVLNIEDKQWALALNDLLQQVISDLLSRYNRMASREKSFDYLIEDMSLYLTLLEFGVLKTVCHEQKAISDSLRVFSERLSESPHQDEVEDKNNETLYERVHLTKSVSFKKDVSYIDNVLDESYNNWKNMQIEKHKEEKMNEFGKSRPVVVEQLYPDWNENQNQKKEKYPDQEFSSRTNFVYNSSSSGQFLQGKDINTYCEADLQKIDIQSLTEDEMMIYAQALSRFEYAKEQTAQVDKVDSKSPVAKVNSKSPDIEVMDLGNSSHSQDNSTDTFEELPGVVVASKQKCSEKQVDTPTTDADKNIQNTSLLHTCQSVLPKPKDLLNVTSHESRQVGSAEIDLICEEDINFDEVDSVMLSSPVLQTDIVSCTERSMYSQVSEPQLSDFDNLTKGIHSCNSKSTDSASMNQTDIGLETKVPQLPKDVGGVPKEQLSPSNVKKFVTSSEYKLTDSSESSGGEQVAGEIVVTRLRSPVKRSAHDSIDKEDHENHSSSKKEYFSPCKTNNLVKTRDYSRLKSPAMSPKKRASRGQQHKSASMNKWLQSDEEKRKSSPDEESLSGEDCSAIDVLNTSLEVNIDDVTFLDNINCSPFVDPTALTISHSTPFSTPKSKNSSSSMIHECVESLPTTSCISASTPAVEETIIQHSPQQIKQIAQPESFALSKKVNNSDTMQENVEMDQSLISSVTIRSVPDNSEEKENMPDETARASSNLQHLEMGKAELSYKLVGIVDHTGSSQYTGHYTAYAFNMRKQKWFYLNDSETEMVTEQEVQEKNTQTGYLFFYMDKDLFNEYADKANSLSLKQS